MKINFFENFHANTVEITQDITWGELVELFKTHEISDSKDGLMFNLSEFKTTDYVPATSKVFLNNEDTGQRVLKHDSNGNTLVARNADNVISVSALILDYDGNGASVENVIERFSTFTHLGYTSYNHIIKGVDKFRVVVPFTHPCPVDEWMLRKNNFLELAGKEVDTTCLSVARAFYTPSCPKHGKEHAFTWSIDGEVLDWEIIPTDPMEQPTYYAVAKVVDDKSVVEALDELRKYYPELHYDDRFKVTRVVLRYLSAAQTINEMRSRWDDRLLNGKYEHMISSCIKNNGPTLGTLIHMIRLFNKTYRVSDDMSKQAHLERLAEYKARRIKELEQIAAIEEEIRRLRNE